VSSVLLLVHPDRPIAVELAALARSWWSEHGYEVYEIGEMATGPANGRTTGLPTDGLDFAISLGGDGTMLRTVQTALPYEAPVLGINLGRMGYLTEVDPPQMLGAFQSLADGSFKVEERMVLEVSVERADGSTLEAMTALNEAIVERVLPGHTIRVEVAISGRRFLTYTADGLLVCTPTGSTAYNLSARGPVVSPTMRALVLTPVAPHLVFDRSLVLAPDETVSSTVLDARAAVLALDGRGDVTLAQGDTVTCRAAQVSARFAVLAERDFHAVLRSRFSMLDR
jgi:NAD+ kinase